jgi:glycosyltransferase involved in cell wall biosynthesis
MPALPYSLSVLVPAYNEEAALAKTVASIERHRSAFSEMEIIVIDDGSNDCTRDIARALPVILIEHDINRGYGAALKEGLRRSKSEFVLITDADGTYPLDEILRLAAEAIESDMVIGARTGKLTTLPLARRIGKWIITRLAEYLTRQTIPDLNSGFRIFRRDVALRFAAIYPDGFSFTTTITLAMLTNHYRVKFVPIAYGKRVGKSSIRPIRDFINFVILIIRICACFKPLSVFVPPALLLIVTGAAKGAIDYGQQHHLGALSVTMALTGIQMLFIGLVADLIDQRMKL